MSNRLTFSLASLIFILALGLVFVPTSVMAHDADGDAAGTQPAGHTHRTAPTVESIELVNIPAGANDDATVRDSSVVLVTGANDTAEIADGDTAAGVFLVKITLSDSLYDADTTAGNLGAPTTTVASFEVGDLTVTAAAQSAPGNDLEGAVADGAVSFAAPAIDNPLTTDTETDNKIYYVLFTVGQELFGGQTGDAEDGVPIDVWIMVNAGIGVSANQLVNGVTTYGTENTASMREKFTVVSEFETPRPNVTITAETGATVDDVFDVTFTFGDPEPGVDAFKKEHITVTGGQVTAGPTQNTADTEVWTATISPVLNATSVSVGVADTFAEGDAEEVTATTPPTVMIAVPSTATVDAPFTVTLTFSKDVALAAADLMVTGGEAGTPMPETPNAAMDTVWTVEISPILNATSVEVGVKAAKATGMAQTVTATTEEEEAMLADKAYAVVVRSKSAAMAARYFGTATPTLIEWAAMPNLHQLFIENTAAGGGGSLQMIAKNAADENLGARKVVFSEIMWAIDERKAGAATDDDDQWFEIYNRSGAAIPISTISFSTKEGRPALAQGTDLVSNAVGGGDRWIRTKGQNGNSGVIQNSVRVDTKEFISMYRNRYDREGWLGRDWTKSTQLYKPNHRGTPGMKEAAGVKTFAASGVALTVVFNEIANYDSANAKYEWIELRIRSGDPNFEKWRVHMVTGAPDRSKTGATNPTQIDLFTMPKLDKGRFDDILLITKTDPAKDPNHPLAAGYNVEVKFEDQDRQGRDKNIRYYVADNPGDIGNGWTENLPDDGNFVLILRNGNDKSNHEKVQDLAGYHPNLTVDRNDLYTQLWPLIGYPAPNLSWNTIDDGEVNQRVYDDIPGTRTKDGNKEDKVAFRHTNNGWTGIGYKRNLGDASRNPGAQYSGTPGYPNNAQRAGNDAAALAAVIVSEVMPSQGDRNLSEWIELRNISDTIGVNVDGWRITIQNHDEDGKGGTFGGKLSEEINLSGNARIPPGQTLLIAARGGRDETKLPKDRIKIVGKKRTEVLINPYGFTIKVESKKDNNYHLVDMVGNLGTPASTRGNAASLVPIAWELPPTVVDGDRVSIIRVSNKTTGALDGTMKEAWITFEGSAQEAGTLDKTYYGHSTDLGSPGHTIGGVLPVSLSKFRPERMKDTGQIVIRWVTESELNNAGFNILRSEKRDGEFTKINTKLIAGQGTTSERTAYTYADTSAKPNVVYYYQIQDVSLDGQVTTLRTTHLRGNVTAVGKATTTWGELKTLHE